MKAIVNIIQTMGMSIVLIVFLKVVLILRKLWLKAAVKIRKKYNKKHGLHPMSGISEIDETSLSYQIDSIEGSIVTVILFLMGLLFTLFVPIEANYLFCIIAIILFFLSFIGCWLMRYSGTRQYRILFYIFGGVSILLILHTLVSFFLNTVLLIGFANSINALLYIWFTMFMYKFLVDMEYHMKSE